MSDGDLFARLAAIDTTCLADAAPDLGVLPADLRPVGRSRRLAGRALTVDARSDLMSTIAAIKASGPGDVLVISAGDDARAAAGELFATEAQRRGVAGIVIDGRSRDSAVVGELDIAVFSRGPAPDSPGAGFALSTAAASASRMRSGRAGAYTRPMIRQRRGLPISS